MTDQIGLFQWNPKRTLIKGRLAQYTRIPLRINNFGDLLGPMVVRAILSRLKAGNADATRQTQLLSVGSVLHFAATGDVIWGTGRNGKVGDEHHTFTDLDVRAVRGPLTRDFLRDRGIAVPEVYGDPALLLPTLFPALRAKAETKTRGITIVPNLNDYPNYPSDSQTLNPRSDINTCLATIATSEMVVGSSLHGIVVAESLGIPARLVTSGAESPFKYRDYYLGSGRDGCDPAPTVSDAIAAGGEPLPDMTSFGPLLRAFPADLWGRESVDESVILADESSC